MDPHMRSDVYVALATRRSTFDSLMWQVPAICLTAQAFLFTIALGSSSPPSARYTSSALALVIAFVAMQTMAKHRYNELTDARMLEAMERQYDVHICGTRPHLPPRIRGAAVGNYTRGWIRLKSADLWLISLGSFGLTGLTVIVLTASGFLK